MQKTLEDLGLGARSALVLVFSPTIRSRAKACLPTFRFRKCLPPINVCKNGCNSCIMDLCCILNPCGCLYYNFRAHQQVLANASRSSNSKFNFWICKLVGSYFNVDVSHSTKFPFKVVSCFHRNFYERLSMKPMICIVPINSHGKSTQPNQRSSLIHIYEHCACVIDANTMQQASSNETSFSFLPWRKRTQKRNNKLSQAKRLGK
jgi:hypothetical protein